MASSIIKQQLSPYINFSVAGAIQATQSFDATTEYVAPMDCTARVRIRDTNTNLYGATIKVSGINAVTIASTAQYDEMRLIPLKKGQTLTFTLIGTPTTCEYTVFKAL